MGYRGRDGGAGVPGKRGGRGAQGDAGDAGDAGTDGIPGIPGEDGAPGAGGPAGPAGPEGPRGPTGAPGAAGLRGLAGGPGAAGRPGARGFKGAMGAYGKAGDAGARGPGGDPGPDGPAGQAGAQGATGSAGPDGPTGNTGPAGPTGNQGAVGNEGGAGSPGDNGLPGDAGAPGPAGPPGPAADLSTILNYGIWDRFNGGQKGPRMYRTKRSLSDTENEKMNEELDQYISKSYKLFKNFTEIWKVVTNKYVKHEGLGSKDEPAESCADLFQIKPTLKSGDYWIDPNAGSNHDAVLVHCNATNYETCIWPKAPVVDSQEYNGDNKYVWALREVNDEPMIAYAASHVQMKLLRVKSERVR